MVDIVKLAAERDGPDSVAAATIRLRDADARARSVAVAEEMMAKNPFLRALAGGDDEVKESICPSAV